MFPFPPQAPGIDIPTVYGPPGSRYRHTTQHHQAPGIDIPTVRSTDHQAPGIDIPTVRSTYHQAPGIDIPTVYGPPGSRYRYTYGLRTTRL
jgi:hypothetical protein